MSVKTKVKKSIVFLLCLSFILSVMSASFFASAADFSGGSGKKGDPYLIKTADDLYNMRNNLSAHYKLAATIDMKGYKTDSKFFKKGFVPIGDDSTKPFTGSFTCDIGSDGLPLYAILNLNVYNAKGDLFNHDFYGESDYPDALGQEAPYYYETGLFGTTDGAYISNIYLINATVYSSVVGQMNGRYVNGSAGNLISYKAFIDEQATGALIARAKNTTVVHCAATGSVKGKSSRHGGLIGEAVSSNISASYVDMDVDTGGCWNVGTFIGFARETTTVMNCYSAGSLNASLDGYGLMLERVSSSKFGEGAGGFAGQVADSVVENCYANVKLTKSTRGNNFYGKSSGNSSISNCYTYGAYQNKGSAPSGSSNTNNCYISNAVKGLQPDFNAASPVDITKYFTSKEGWKAGSGKYPVLEAVNIVTDTGIYVPGGERETTVVVTPSVDIPEKDTTSSNADNTQNANTNSTNSTTDANNTQNENTNSTNSTTDVDNSQKEEGNLSQPTTENVIETVAPEEEKVDTIQIIFIVFLIIMVVAVSFVTVVMIYNTLRFKPEIINGEKFSESIPEQEEENFDE